MDQTSDMPHPSDRRRFLHLLTGGAALVALGACGQGRAATGTFRVRHSEAEWRKRLTKGQFHILREAGTERPFTSPLLKEHRKGTFACAGCATPVYDAATKYDSGTGWPSFWQAIAGNTATSRDFALGYPRTEVHCATCGGHLGHIFDDGPRPTGKRHCINGLALTFRPAKG